MNINGKVWGTTSALFNKNNVEIHRLKIKKGGYCSKHCHNFKFNMFFVESGSLEVEVQKNNYPLTDRTQLKEGDSTIIEPGEYHLFKALEDSEVLEIYWVELKMDDINRQNCGGYT